MRSLAISTALLTCTLLPAQTPTPTVTGLVNPGTQQPGPIAPGQQVNIVGSNLGDPQPQTCGGGAIAVPTICGGVSVLLNGQAVPVRSQSAQQIAFYTPVTLTGTAATVQVTRQAGGQTVQSAVFNATVAPTAPGLFTTNVNGVTFGQFQDPNGVLITPNAPAKAGDTVKVLGAGFGVTNPAFTPGTVVPNSPPYNVVATVRVTVGGQNAVVSSATRVPGGLGATDQVVFQVPAGLPGGNQPVVVNVGGQNSQTLQLPLAFSGPRVTSVVNSASNAVPGLPNAGVAPGSIVVAYGSLLGPATLTVAPGYPWPATLSGTSAQVTVNGRTTSLLLYYTSANQIAGLLPSSTPPGTGTITVTYNGQAGGPSPITVLQNNFGVYTVPQNGSGPGIVTFPDYSLVSQTKAANPGETLIIWGTGLGAVSGDEAAGALPGDMTNLPVQVWLGGVSATVVYRGRSGCCVGEDQIAFVVPADVTGCNLPLAVQINNQVSNYSTMAVAASGRACVPSVPVVPTSVANLPEPRIGFVELEREVNPPPQSPQDQPSSDTASVSMFRLGVSGAELNIRNDGPAPGSCMVIPGGSEESDPPILGLLNAGPALTLRGPGGATKTIPRSGTQYAARIGDTTPGNFLDPGAFTLTGPGGPDVAAFTASFTIPAFTWTNKPESNTMGINRPQGARITWTGGDPEGYVRIGGEAGAPTSGAFVAFECIARAASGSFTIPPSVLLALPANGRGVLTVSSRPSITLFTAGGLDFGGIATSASFRVFANYQ